MKKIIFMMLVVFSSSAFSAGTCTSCRIKNLGFGDHYNDYCKSGSCVFIMVEGNLTNRPACSKQGWHFTLDTSTAAGMVTLSALLSAHSDGKTVNVQGKGHCSNITGDDLFEDLKYIYF